MPNMTVQLRANNGQFVCAEGGGGREVVANRNAVGPWETFTVSVLPPRHVRIEVESVRCGDTEDVTGTDELYLVGAAASRTNVTGKPILTKRSRGRLLGPDGLAGPQGQDPGRPRAERRGRGAGPLDLYGRKGNLLAAAGARRRLEQLIPS